jgi:NAD(P)-dependent dehydrogenase (short-subunit alcohol dehydrogenase family)
MILAYAKAGASYIAAGARSDMSQLAKDVEAAAMSANRNPPKFLALQLEVTDSENVEEAAATVEKMFGRCDVLVNNAGVIGSRAPIADSNPESWWQVIDVNVRGSYLVSRAFLPLMLKTGDSYIVNVSSVGAHLISPGMSAYQISKLAILKFSQFLNTEYVDKGVTSFSIHPGNCVTDMVGGPEGLMDNLRPSTYQLTS